MYRTKNYSKEVVVRLRVKNIEQKKYCNILSVGNTDRVDSDKFKIVSQYEFIKLLKPETQRSIVADPDFAIKDDAEFEQKIKEAADTWGEMVSVNRTFFNGDVTELAVIAARKCLTYGVSNFGFDANTIDAIIGATNTGPGYPSLADFVKEGLNLRNDAMCFDVTEACVAGSVAVFQGWSLITSGACRNVLVVASEKATTLTDLENWQGSNLFGDGAFAMLLTSSNNQEDESFDYFEFNSFPHDGNLKHIQKTETGFVQVGKKVHIFVIRDVVNALQACIAETGYKIDKIKHLIFHQPSNKTISSLLEKLSAMWPEFNGVIHRGDNMGNISSASFGHLLSTKFHSGAIKKGEPILSCTFGAGLSLGIMVFRM